MENINFINIVQCQSFFQYGCWGHCVKCQSFTSMDAGGVTVPSCVSVTPSSVSFHLWFHQLCISFPYCLHHKQHSYLPLNIFLSLLFHPYPCVHVLFTSLLHSMSIISSGWKVISENFSVTSWFPVCDPVSLVCNHYPVHDTTTREHCTTAGWLAVYLKALLHCSASLFSKT